MFILYNSPFIWNAPTEEDLRNWKSNLNKPLEVLLWVRWSTGRDVTYWNKLIQHTMDLNYIDPYGDDVKELNPIFDRLLECGISPSFISFEVEQYGMTPAYAEMFATPRVFNILWVRYLGRHYKDSFLGYLLERINPTSGIVASLPVEFNRRPGSYRLM